MMIIFQWKHCKTQGTPLFFIGDVAKQKEVADMLLEIAGQDKIQAVEKLKEITAFQGKDGNMVPGLDSTKKLTGKRLDIAHSKVKKEYEQFQSQMRAAQ